MSEDEQEATGTFPHWKHMSALMPLSLSVFKQNIVIESPVAT